MYSLALTIPGFNYTCTTKYYILQKNISFSLFLIDQQYDPCNEKTAKTAKGLHYFKATHIFYYIRSDDREEKENRKINLNYIFF